ncbi:MAG: hypothetical protein KDK28_13935 [Maritimibacter sp.]|nr:hypothetical protein [Maritimibacter sp.]
MTTSSYSPAPLYAISGIGPYDVPYEYASVDELKVSVIIDEVAIALAEADYSVVPEGPATSGTVFLNSAAAAEHDGKTLTVTRDSNVSQSWVGLSATAIGLENQLDQMTRAIQENQIATERSLRVVGDEVFPYQPQDGRVPYWDSGIGSFANGLNYSDLLAGIEAAQSASNRVDIAFNAISGGKWRADAPTLIADTDLTYVPDQNGTVTEGVKIVTQSEGFGYAVAAPEATDHHVATAGGVKLYVLPGSDGRANIRAFGATGIAGDDQDAAMVAAAAFPAPVAFPKGTYDFSTNLSPVSEWVGIDKGNNAFALSDGAELRFFGTGLALDLWYGFEDFTLRSMAAGQSGIRIKGGIGYRYGPGRIFDFDGIGMAIGDSPTYAAYFLDIGSFEINNQNRDGAIGFLISGGATPNSNANRIQCPFVKGRFKRYFDISGHANILIGGDAEPDENAVTGGIDEVIRIAGIGNVWMSPYIEPIGGDFPDVMFRFESTSVSNKVRDVYAPSWPIPFASTLDAGTGNAVEINQTGANFTPSIGVPKSSVNLLPNAHFLNLKTDGMPVGWNRDANGSSTVSRDNTHRRGGQGIKLTCTGDGHANINAWVSANGPGAGRNTLTRIPGAKLQGKTVTVGAWVWSATPGFGVVKVFHGSAWIGTAQHSGSGEWEYLTIQQRLSDAGTEFGFAVWANINGAATTGECWVCDPAFVFGTELPQIAEPRPLHDGEAVLAGRIVESPAITFVTGDQTPDVSEGNVFLTQATGTGQITNFDGKPDGPGAQTITIICQAQTYFYHNAFINMKGGATRLVPAGEVIRFVYVSNLLKWFEI